MESGRKRKAVQTAEERKLKAQEANRKSRAKKKQRLEELEKENQHMQDEIQRLSSVVSSVLQEQEVVRKQYAGEFSAWNEYRVRVEQELAQKSLFVEGERQKLQVLCACIERGLQQRQKALEEQRAKLAQEKRKWVQRLLVCISVFCCSKEITIN